MGMPKRIKEAAEAADAAMAELTRQETQALTVDPVTGELPSQTPPVETPPAPPSEDFEKKYSTLKGKYDSEMPLMRSQIQQYERLNQQLSTQVAQLSEQVQALTRQTPEPTPQASSVTDTDVSQFGPELIDLIRRVGAEIMSPQIELMRSEISRLVGSVSGNVQTVVEDQKVLRRQGYEDGLTQAVPNWRDINAQPEWLSWLGEFDPILGSTRQAAISAAYDSYNVPRTVAFLKQFIAQSTPAPVVDVQDELKHQVSPRSTTGVTPPSSAPDTASRRVWTQAEIGEVYKAQIQGRNRLSPEAFAAVEAEIAQAVAEGRVR